MSWSIGDKFGSKKALTKVVEEYRAGSDESDSQKEFMEAKPIILGRLSLLKDDMPTS